MNPVARMLNVEGLGRDEQWVMVWCPGCEEPHAVAYSRNTDDGATWEWNGSLGGVDSPRPITIEPSIRVDYGERLSGHLVCHSFIRHGRWEFLGDSTHALAGQVVDLVPLPDYLMRGGGDGAGADRPE